MRLICNWLTAFLGMAVLSTPLAYGLDVAAEEAGVQSASQQSQIACGATGLSQARADLAAGLIRRINTRMANLTQEMNQRKQTLDQLLFPAQAAGAQIDGDLALARAALKSAQWEYDTATMYRKYSASNVVRTRKTLSDAQSRVAALEAEKSGAARDPASTPRSGLNELAVDQATTELAALADLSDRYQQLRDQTSFCRSRSLGWPGQTVNNDGTVQAAAPDSEGAPAPAPAANPAQSMPQNPKSGGGGGGGGGGRSRGGSAAR